MIHKPRKIIYNFLKIILLVIIVIYGQVFIKDYQLIKVQLKFGLENQYRKILNSPYRVNKTVKNFMFDVCEKLNLSCIGKFKTYYQEKKIEFKETTTCNYNPITTFIFNIDISRFLRLKKENINNFVIKTNMDSNISASLFYTLFKYAYYNSVRKEKNLKCYYPYPKQVNEMIEVLKPQQKLLKLNKQKQISISKAYNYSLTILNKFGKPMNAVFDKCIVNKNTNCYSQKCTNKQKNCKEVTICYSYLCTWKRKDKENDNIEISIVSLAGPYEGKLIELKYKWD